MNIIVTGGAGFIGSHLVDELIRLGHRVAVIDNLSTGLVSRIHPQAKFYHMDISDTRIKDIFARFEPEVVVHLAAQTNVQLSSFHPVQDAKENIIGSLHLLEACVDVHVRKFIFASSAAVYGNPEIAHIEEDHSIQPISAYGISKFSVEQYINLLAMQHNIDFTILRYANVFGDRQGEKGEGGVVSSFINCFLQQQTPLIYGSGEQTRDFIYVKDVVNANVAALTSGALGCFNIGTGQSTSINELLHHLNVIFGKKVEALYSEMRPCDIAHSCLDNRRAASRLHWHPAYTIQSGLERTVEYFLHHSLS